MLWWLLETTVVAAALAGAVAVLCRRLRPRPAVRHALWLIVLLKLLTPPLLAWPWPAPAAVPLADEPSPRPPPAPAAEEIVPALPPSEPATAAGPVEAGPWDAEPEAIPEPERPAGAPAPVPAGPPADRWPTALVAVWVGGALLMALLQLVRIARFRRLVSRGEPAPAALAEALAALAARLGVRPPPIVVLSGLGSPVVWGLGRPRLLWPAALLGRLSPDGERTAIVHELAHLRRRDHWVGWLQLVASCVWWWSPLFWHVRRQVGRAAELSCDAWVIEVLPSARRAYALALLEVCELVSRRAAPEPALGMGGARPEIERRLTMILRESVPSRVPVRALFGVVLLALVALPGITGGQPGPDPTRSPYTAPAKEPPAAVDAFQPAARAPVAANFQPAAKATADEREQRLQKLEATLDALLKEVHDLRGAAGKQSAPAAKTTGAATKPTNAPQAGYYRGTANQSGQNNLYWEKPATQDHPVHLVRSTYKLPKDKAEALAAALKGVKASVLETQVTADGIVVTTTPEVDHVVGEFVGLLQGNVPSARTGYRANFYESVPAAKRE